MTDTLENLESRRSDLYRQMMALGDFRPGTISVNYRKCGKPKCACSQLGHPGHGPQYLWNTTSGGKSRAQSLQLGPQLEKARIELEHHRIFLCLCKELVEVNEKICRLRPVVPIKDEKELDALKKNCRGNSRGNGVGNGPVDAAHLPRCRTRRARRLGGERNGYSRGFTPHRLQPA
jgi:hypothetical protein